MADSKKRYTNFALRKIEGKDGPVYPFTATVFFSEKCYRGKKATTSGKTFAQYNFALEGRTDWVNKCLGVKLSETNGVLWANGSVWDSESIKLADRFDKMVAVAKDRKVLVTLVGTMSVKEQYLNATITDFWLTYLDGSSGGNAGGSDGNSGSGNSNSGVKGTTVNNGFVTINDDDDELPF